MMLILHLTVAFASLVLATFAFFAPSKTKLHLSYGLVAATLATGTILVVMAPAHLAQACVSGLVYLAVVAAALVAARHRLALR